MNPGYDPRSTQELPESDPRKSFLFHKENRNTGAIARLWDAPAVPPRLFLEIEDLGRSLSTVLSAVSGSSGGRYPLSQLSKACAHPSRRLPGLAPGRLESFKTETVEAGFTTLSALPPL